MCVCKSVCVRECVSVGVGVRDVSLCVSLYAVQCMCHFMCVSLCVRLFEVGSFCFSYFCMCVFCVSFRVCPFVFLCVCICLCVSVGVRVFL